MYGRILAQRQFFCQEQQASSSIDVEKESSGGNADLS